MPDSRKVQPVALFLIAMLAAAALIVAALFFLVPERTQVHSAALADGDCYASLPDGEKAIFAPLYAGGKLWRMKETLLRRQWMLENGLSVLQVATVAYGEVTPACRRSILGLVDAYVANGADINMISDTRRQWTVLQGATVMSDPGLTCAILRRGASLDAKFSRPGAPIDGLTVVQFAKRSADANPASRDARRVAETIEQYRASGRCSE